MNKRLIIFIIIVITVSFIVFPHWIRFWQIDACLDSGGSWNYLQNCCNYENGCENINVFEWPILGKMLIIAPPIFIGFIAGIFVDLIIKDKFRRFLK